MFLPHKPGVIAYAGMIVVSMRVQTAFKIYALPWVEYMLFQEKLYQMKDGLVKLRNKQAENLVHEAKHILVMVQTSYDQWEILLHHRSQDLPLIS